MKNKSLLTVFILFFVAIPALFVSCEDMMGDFLEKAPGVDVSEDTIFSSKVQVETFLASIYQYGMHSNLSYAGSSEASGRIGYANPEATMMTGASDESECTTNWYFPQQWNQGTINPNTGQNDVDARFSYRFNAIRMITVLLDRIDEVPDLADTDKRRMIAEAKVIRALNYLEMFKRYGGMPVIDRRLSVSDDLKIPRNTVAEVVDFIVRDCAEAYPDLPLHQLGANRGRIHQGVALAIKSKTLLYAASPLFNTATPYLSFGEHNSLVCYGDYKKERWEAAAEAADACLRWAAQAGCILITDKGVNSNYLYTWDTYDNMEIILADKSQVSTGRWIWPWGEFTRYAAPNKGYGGTSPLLNFVRKYEDRDGKKVDWNPVGITGYDVQEKMLSLDRRFAQTILYNMSKWNADIVNAPLYQEAIPEIEGGTNAKKGAITDCCGGFWLHKGCPYIIDNVTWSYIPNSTLFQLNEIYMNYAEAMYEAYGADSDPKGYGLTARGAINVIRNRSGQPQVLSGSGIYPDFKELVRNERAIELAFDNHRFWDVRRWMIAEEEGVMQGRMIGIIINLTDPSAKPLLDKGYKYTPYVYETRVFHRKMYLHPFVTNEVNKGYLVQNPGY